MPSTKMPAIHSAKLVVAPVCLLLLFPSAFCTATILGPLSLPRALLLVVPILQPQYLCTHASTPGNRPFVAILRVGPVLPSTRSATFSAPAMPMQSAQDTRSQRLRAIRPPHLRRRWGGEFFARAASAGERSSSVTWNHPVLTTTGTKERLLVGSS